MARVTRHLITWASFVTPLSITATPRPRQRIPNRLPLASATQEHEYEFGHTEKVDWKF